MKKLVQVCSLALLLSVASCGKVRYPLTSTDADGGLTDVHSADYDGRVDQRDGLTDEDSSFPSGTVLDPDGIVVENNACENCRRPVLACSKTSRLLIWSTQGQKHLMLARLNKEGKAAAEPTPILPEDTSSWFLEVDIAPGPSQQFLIILTGSRDVLGIFISADGTVTKEMVIANSDPYSPGAPTLAFNETVGNYFIGWMEYWEYASPGVHASNTRVTPEGELLDPFKLSGPSEGHTSSASIDCNETDCLYTSSHSSDDIYAALVKGSGQVAAAQQKLIIDTPNVEERRPVVASGGEGFFVAWATLKESGEVKERKIGGTYLDKNGAPQDLVPIADVAVAAYPEIASSGGDSFIVVWADDMGIRAVRVQRTKVLDKPPIVVSAMDGENSDVSLCFDGTSYLVTWLNRPEKGLQSIYAARIVP